MNVTQLHTTPDPMADCERAIAAAVDALERATGQQVAMLDLLYCDANGQIGRLCGQTHRCVAIGMQEGAGAPWVRSFSGEAI